MVDDPLRCQWAIQGRNVLIDHLSEFKAAADIIDGVQRNTIAGTKRADRLSVVLELLYVK